MTKDEWVQSTALEVVGAGASDPHDVYRRISAARERDNAPHDWVLHAHLAVGDLLHGK
jgi:hypothetical protein